MEQQKIRELIDVLMASDLAELEFVDGDCRLRLVRRSRSEPASRFPPEVGLAESDGGLQRPANAPESDSVNFAGLATPPSGLVRSPLYGILHLTSAPDAPAFVQAGDLVHPGQTLCVVEAMKIFHEVKAETRARVETVLGLAGQEVDAGAPLFRMAAAA